MTSISNFKFQISNWERGFTFIELIVVFSVIAVLSSVGIASFVSYSRIQQLNSSSSELVTLINLAKSRSASQVKFNNMGICSNNATLEGYEVRICGLASSNCISGISTFGFELDVKCSDGTGNIPGYSKKLPSPITFDSTPSSGTTTTSVFFPIFSGGAYGSGRIVLLGVGTAKKTITVNSSGTIMTE